MNALTKYFAQGLGKQTMRDAWKAGGWKVLIDGNLAEQMVEHGPGGELVGVDQHGNKYYEKKDAQIVRNRWVVYAKASDYRTQDPSTVPPEWHGWLHQITDQNPTNHQFVRPVYAVEALAHPTMSPDHHLPKGAWENPEKRTWRKFQLWTPPAGRRA